MDLQIQIKEGRSGHPVVELVGRLDGATSEQCEKELLPLAERAEHALVLHIGGLTYISSLGLRVILQLRKRLHQHDARLIVAHIPAALAPVFEMANILPETDVFESVESADIFLEALQNRARAAQDNVED